MFLKKELRKFEFLQIFFVGVLFSVLVDTTTAATVKYNTNSLGSGVWQYNYTLEGSAPAGGFDGLTIYFEASSFGTLSAPTAPIGWDSLIVQHDTSLPSDGFFDVLRPAGRLTGNVASTSFSLRIEYLGAAFPGSQRFELYQSSPFNVVAFGETSAVGAIPEPSTAAFLLFGLGGVVLAGRRQASVLKTLFQNKRLLTNASTVTSRGGFL